MYHQKEHTVSVMLVLAVYLLAACAPAAPITDNQVLSLFQGGTAAGIARPAFVAVSEESALATWPIQSGNGSGAVGWGVACIKGNCPPIPGNFFTAAALSKYFNDLAAAGFQIYSRAAAFASGARITPLILPLTPEMLEGLPAAKPQG